MRILLSVTIFLSLHLAQNLNGEAISPSKAITHGGQKDAQNDVYTSRYAYLLELQSSMDMLEQRLGQDISTVEEENKKEEWVNKKQSEVNLTGKAKGFSNRNYAGVILSCEEDISGICASRQHPGVFYYIRAGNKNEKGESIIYAYDTNKRSIIVEISLDAVNTDWEDIACGPCDSDGFGHCIYVSDTGHTGEGPSNLIYKVQEPEEVIQGRKLSLGEDEIEVIGFESTLKNSKTLMVSPRGRIFLMDSSRQPRGLYEIDEYEAKHLFNVALPNGNSYEGPSGGDISVDGKGFLIKFKEEVFYWYVDAEEDMEKVLTDSKQSMQLPYWTETFGESVAWSLDGASYFTVSAGCNEPLYRYERLDHATTAVSEHTDYYVEYDGDDDDEDDVVMPPLGIFSSLLFG
ncbi:uncharacterized protein LOC124130936 [Haliotis rufescens]|uniref:uncharacterized protein LOC124130936 n=1 Tax=Haliotis rufescens TaxID=6454 RepID=UPI00201F0B4B|nr:uncharacterized protein LOC124130936 [Haliotis rufescens]